MLAFVRHCCVGLLLTALLAGHALTCSGWLPSAEARMTCCTDGTCPMHKGEEAVPPSATHTISQAEADACCAAASEGPADPSGTSASSLFTVAVLGNGVAIPLVAPASVVRTEWRMVVPLRDASPPKHVLHAVFLV